MYKVGLGSQPYSEILIFTEMFVPLNGNKFKIPSVAHLPATKSPANKLCPDFE